MDGCESVIYSRHGGRKQGEGFVFRRFVEEPFDSVGELQTHRQSKFSDKEPK